MRTILFFDNFTIRRIEIKKARFFSGLPVFSWRKAKSSKDKGEHLRTAIGSKYHERHWHESGKILGFIPYTLENYETKRYWLVHDNGLDMNAIGKLTNAAGNPVPYWEYEMEGYNQGRSKYGVEPK